MVTTSSEISRASNHVTVIRGLKESPQALALRALRAISKSAASTLLLDTVPSELLFGERVDLHRWTLVVRDETLDELSKQQSSAKQFYLNSYAEDLPGIFRTFWTPTACPNGLMQLNVSWAKEITDFGLTLVARASPALVSLNVAGCSKLTDVGLRELSLSCRQLQDLNISSCTGIEGQGLAAIADGCINLTRCNVSKCSNLKNWSLQKLFRGCTRLEEVVVSYNKDITDEEIRVLAEHCPDLILLEAVECLYLSDQSVLSLAQHCRDLDSLDLGRSEMAYRISDVSLMALGQKALSLRTLKLNHCDQLSDVGLGWLAEGCKLLELLDLGGCNKVTDAGLRVLGAHCHALTSLDISHAKAVSDVGLASLARGCPALRTLKCHGLFLLTDPSLAAGSTAPGKTLEAWEEVIGLAALATRCPLLSSLDVSGCFRLNRLVGQYLPRLARLRSLNLKGCSQCQPTALLALAQAVPELESLVLADTGKAVNAKVLSAFAQHCVRLHTLHVSRCPDLGEAAIRAISFMSNLQALDCVGCKSLTDSMLVHLAHIERLPQLSHLDVSHCPKLGDSFVAWISLKPHQLLTLCMLGTAVTRKALQSVRDRFPHCDLVVNANFFGFWPKHRVRDRKLLNAYHQMILGITKLQARHRKHVAILRVRNIQHERRRMAAHALLQRMARGFLARRRVRRMFALRRLMVLSAVRIAAIFRRVVAKRRVARRRAQLMARLQHRMATRIQCAYRRHRGQCVLRRLRANQQRRHEHRVAATIVLQSFLRMLLAKDRVHKIKALRQTHERVRQAKALVLQRVFRGSQGRFRVHQLRQRRAALAAQRAGAIVTIQRYFRRHRTERIVAHRRRLHHRRLAAIVCIQSTMRGALARLQVMELRMETWLAHKKRAVLQIQCRWRVYKARCDFFQRIKERMGLRARIESAANTIIRQARVKLACLVFRRKHSEYIARLTAQAARELQAATTIQAMIRSHQGRKRFHAKLEEKKNQWKELFDEEKGKRFFYNKRTGEVRWRIPQDLLDLIPHPTCDNCTSCDAMLECAVCNELFCGPCFQRVHSGGRRAAHDYRALYDFYGRRLDYGDGDFPCQWPSEVIQDEVQGWMLRINPLRKPVEVYKQSSWEKYEEVHPGKRTLKNRDEWRVKDSLGPAAPRTFFFNRQTFETSYEMPPEVAREEEERARQALTSASYGLGGFGLPLAALRTPFSRPQSVPAIEAGGGDMPLQQWEGYEQADYDPAHPWYHGYYDEAGQWVAYDAGAVGEGGGDPSMALVIAPGTGGDVTGWEEGYGDSLGFTRLQYAESYGEGQAGERQWPQEPGTPAQNY